MCIKEYVSKNYGSVFPYFGEKINQRLGKIQKKSSALSSFLEKHIKSTKFIQIDLTSADYAETSIKIQILNKSFQNNRLFYFRGDTIGTSTRNFFSTKFSINNPFICR
jgi:hypothetical protein